MGWARIAHSLLQACMKCIRGKCRNEISLLTSVTKSLVSKIMYILDVNCINVNFLL